MFQAMVSHAFLNLSLPTKLVNIPNLVKLVPSTMVVIALKSLMVHWVNTASMVNSMVLIDSIMTQETIMAIYFMAWVTMTILLVGMLTTSVKLE